MLEANLEKKICQQARKLGWSAFKFSSPNNRGVADRIFLRNGVTLFLEIKRPGQKPTKLQEKFLRDMRKQKIFAYWTDSLDDSLYYLKRLSNEDAKSEVDFSLNKNDLKA